MANLNLTRADATLAIFRSTSAVNSHMALAILPAHWGSATVVLEWSIDGRHWYAMPEPVTLCQDVPARAGICLQGVPRTLRLRVSDSDWEADPVAEVALWLSPPQMHMPDVISTAPAGPQE